MSDDEGMDMGGDGIGQEYDPDEIKFATSLFHFLQPFTYFRLRVTATMIWMVKHEKKK